MHEVRRDEGREPGLRLRDLLVVEEEDVEVTDFRRGLVGLAWREGRVEVEFIVVGESEDVWTDGSFERRSLFGVVGVLRAWCLALREALEVKVSSKALSVRSMVDMMHEGPQSRGLGNVCNYCGGQSTRIRWDQDVGDFLIWTTIAVSLVVRGAVVS